MMVDTHAHAHFKAYQDDYEEVIQRSLDKGTIVNLVGTQSDTSRKAVEVAETFDNVYASVGLHPEHLFSKHVDEEETTFRSREESFDYEYYKKLCVSPKVIGIGECGLDFYRIPEGMTKEMMLPKQKEVFLEHIRLAKETNLPMVIHCRAAHEELITLLNEVRPSASGGKPLTGTIHCYTNNWANAQKYLDMGFYLGFTGVITFPPYKKNPQAQEDLLQVVQKMPSDRILLETDCPYLSPIPYRGQRGEPWMVEATAAKIAELRQVSLNEIIEITTRNAKKLFTQII